MKAFEELWEVAHRLHGPNGCPWDHKQTFFSLQSHILEEACELVDAIDQGDHSNIVEELGDLLYVVLFYGKIADSFDVILTYSWNKRH